MMSLRVNSSLQHDDDSLEEATLLVNDMPLAHVTAEHNGYVLRLRVASAVSEDRLVFDVPMSALFFVNQSIDEGGSNGS